VILLQTIGLYLAARAALPDRVEIGKPIDLRSYYDFVDRYLWSALSFSYGGFIFLNSLAPIMLGKIQFPSLFIQALIGFPFILALAIWPSRRLHQIVVPLLFLWLCVRVLPARLLIA
jgi:hypothetical protein